MLDVLKSRGMAHSNQVREFVLTKRGLTLVDAVRDSRGRVLMGSRRAAHGTRPATAPMVATSRANGR